MPPRISTGLHFVSGAFYGASTFLAHISPTRLPPRRATSECYDTVMYEILQRLPERELVTDTILLLMNADSNVLTIAS
jgi:hypothetical protein